MVAKAAVDMREPVQADVKALLAIEQACFETDRLSKRSFRHHLHSAHSIMLVVEKQHQGNAEVVGYGLCLLHRGTRLARLYSLAILPGQQGNGLGAQLLQALENRAEREGRLHMRLEVSKSNNAAIQLYEASGYRRFGEYIDYYDDHSDAVRMQKTIRHPGVSGQRRKTSWYPQTTEFTCGPASLMMAMASLNANTACTQELELDLWRESTTIFMTSGLGGTHPFGLALAAKKRGYTAQVFVNTTAPLFIDGVRSGKKKNVMTQVHYHFKRQCAEQGVVISHTDVSQYQVEQWLAEQYAVVILISTYRLDGKKAPHWVLITGIDSHCLYVHDPDIDEDKQLPMDCQHVPIARSDFDKMSVFGASRLRCTLVLK